MKKIYVRLLGDNDFPRTVEPFVRAIGEQIFCGYWTNITKQDIIEMFNEHAYSFYMMHQHRSTKQMNDKDKTFYKDYLKIDERCVMFDNEVDEFLASNQWNCDGCAVYFIDGKEPEYHVF